ncbi:MAG: peptidoglycan DD-metalloendopeptidase family protein [Deltaproteobacteria bacterium]|nr:peptidoglycan DD-metalloendopeptidase family protein [Deltaproteobacteria bacterium]
MRAKVAFVVVAMLFGVLGTSFAQLPVAPRERLKELKNALDERRDALKDLDNKERSLILTIGKLDRDFAKLTDAHALALDEKKLLDARLNSVEKEVSVAQENFGKVEKKLQRRMRHLYVLGRGGAMRHLLGAERFSDLSLRKKAFQLQSEADASLLSKYQKELALVEKLRLRHRDAAHAARIHERELSIQADILEATRKERAAAMGRIDREKELAVRVVREIVKGQRRAQRELSALIRKAPRVRQRRGRGVLKNGLLWPVFGPVLRNFGLKREQKSKAKVMSNGMHIQAPLGSAVATPADAQVVFQGWQRGLGRIVILDHGEGHHTIFGHLSRSVVERGEELTRGQTLGYTGDTESFQGPKLYFELREKGKPRNPHPYLRRK